MHRDTRYKWKPIREKTTSYYCCDAKASSNSLSPLIFCRLQPIGGSYLNSSSYNLQGSSNSHQFSRGTNLWEAPTSVSYNWHLSSYNLMWKHQLSSIFCRLQPIGGSYLSQLQLTSIKLQLDREAPTSSLFQKKTLADLPGYQLCYVPSSLLSSSLHICLISSLTLHNISICSSFFLFSLLQLCIL